MGIVLDLILALIVVVCILLAVKKGFVRSLIEVVGYVLAIIIAFSVSGIAANYIYDNVIDEVVVETVSTAIEENSDKALEALPDYLTVLLEQADFDIESLLNTNDSDALSVAKQASDNILRPLAVGILKTVISVVAFLILMIIVKLLAKAINSMFKGAVLGTANKVLGMALGGVKGVVIATIFSMIVYFVASLSENDFLFFTNEAINESVAAKFIIDFVIGRF